MVAANHVAYTAPINPSGATPLLTISQVWSLLQRKVRNGEDFITALVGTDVLSTSTNEQGFPVTEREVVFREGNRRVHETCIEYAPMKVDFLQPNGGRVSNILAEGAGGEEDLYLTYTFEWIHPECDGDEAALKEKRMKEKALAKASVESTIKVMRQMVLDSSKNETANGAAGS